jgi:hypothetical protein
MANRPIYIPEDNLNNFVKTENVEFTWYAGMAISQKQKSIASLHQAAKAMGICQNPLEVSSKSPNELGVRLSAFNLTVKTEKYKRQFTVEAAYQSSKVFQHGGPYKDLLYGQSILAKKDTRLKESGELIGFDFFGIKWSLEPQTAFYDWLYLNALNKNSQLIKELNNYDAFTDIEFNHKKSISCQAYSLALFKSLNNRGLFNHALKNQESFLDVIANHSLNNTNDNPFTQKKLL